jgi:hypothetical protein
MTRGSMRHDAGRVAGRIAARVILTLATVASCTSRASPALAQSPPTGAGQPDEDRRTALYREGFDAATTGRWAEAKERFAAALAIRASPKVFFSLAQAEEQLGQLAVASHDYTSAIDGAKAAGESDVTSAAERALAALDPRVPRVRIVTDANGATASLDGQPIAVGALVSVDPGGHQLVVSAPGMRDARAMVAISEKQRLDVPMHLDAIGGEPGAVAAPPANPTSGPRAVSPDTGATSAHHGISPWSVVGLATAGAGVVSLGIGSYFGLQAKSQYDQSNRSGCSGDNCTKAAASIRGGAVSAGNTATALFVVGGALLAGGLVLWLVAPSAGGDGGVGVTHVAFGPGGGIALSGGWE